MFSTILLQTLIHCAIIAATPHASLAQAQMLDPQTPSMTTTAERVPGSNNATFCNVPSSFQLFSVEFLEVAPSPLPVDKIIFVYLRGTVPTLPGLADSSLRITSEAALASGGSQEPVTYTIPLKTTSFGDNAHLAIRNATGAYVEGLSSGLNDVLTDNWIPGMFLQTGWWTFRVEGVLPDGRCVFCFQTKEWLEGEYKGM